MLAIFAALYSGSVPVFDSSTSSLITIAIGVWFSVGLLPGLAVSARLSLTFPGKVKGVATDLLIPCCTSLLDKLSVLFDRTMSDFVLTLSSFMLLDLRLADSAAAMPTPKPLFSLRE